jgi:Bacterial Ig-like domain (group 3)
VNLTATVKFVGKSLAAPAGSVTFTDGSAILATVALHDGKATFRTSILPIGKNMIRAAYDGSPNAKRSKSPNGVFVLSKRTKKARLIVLTTRPERHPADATIKTDVPG